MGPGSADEVVVLREANLAAKLLPDLAVQEGPCTCANYDWLGRRFVLCCHGAFIGAPLPSAGSEEHPRGQHSVDRVPRREMDVLAASEVAAIVGPDASSRGTR